MDVFLISHFGLSSHSETGNTLAFLASVDHALMSSFDGFPAIEMGQPMFSVVDFVVGFCTLAVA
jgi:hypothetical protein